MDAVFDRLNTALSNPNKTLKADSKTNDRLKAEQIYSNLKRWQCLVCAAKKGARGFIVIIVKETWYRRLEDNETYYSAVLPNELLTHLSSAIGDTESDDILALQLTLHNAWANNPCVPSISTHLMMRGRHPTTPSYPSPMHGSS